MAERQATCCECGKQFSFTIGRGTDRTFCGADCYRQSTAARITSRKASYPVCTVDGCTRLSRSVKGGHCEAHYYRVRRNGVIDLQPVELTALHSNGYVLEYLPQHWLSGRSKGSRIYQHRRVYFDNHGEGPFTCHWCGVEVTWDTMDVDHVNAVKDDNHISNLVASCPPCNVRRGVPAMMAAMRLRSESKLTWRGECLTLGQWAERVGVSRESMAYRLKAGWPIDRMMTEGRGKTGPRTAQRP